VNFGGLSLLNLQTMSMAIGLRGGDGG